MATLKELRLEARLSVNRLAHIAQVDRQTVDRAENGQAVQDVKAYGIVQALAQQLGRKITLQEVEGLNIL
jgi:predicted transcriptional regulator